MGETTSKLGLFAAIFVVLGNIVGVMIFFIPGVVAGHLPWAGWFLAAWALGGVLALLGALSLGELGAMMPEAGGDYIYIREAYGERTAFLSGWTSVVITFPGSIAVMSVGLCFFQAPALFGAWVQGPALVLDFGQSVYEVKWAQVMAFGVIVFLTGINHLGLRLSGWVQTVVTATPILLLLAAGVGALLVEPSGAVPRAVSTAGKSGLSGLWPAIVPIFFAYAGWNVTTYIGGEIDRPGRNIPLSLIVGTLLAVAVYLIVCLVLLAGVPAAAMPNAKPFVPAVAATRLFGGWAGSVLTLVIALAVLGSLNATVLAGARISYAMAGHGLASCGLRTRSPRFDTPATALWVQAALAAVLVLTGRFEQLVNYTVGVMLVFSSIAVASVVVLRVRRPEVERPYRTLGYPVTPILYVLFSAAVVVGLCIKPKSRTEVIWGVVITAIGVPVCEWLRRRRAPGSNHD